jgi:hypothetical protein
VLQPDLPRPGGSPLKYSTTPNTDNIPIKKVTPEMPRSSGAENDQRHPRDEEYPTLKITGRAPSPTESLFAKPVVVGIHLLLHRAITVWPIRILDARLKPRPTDTAGLKVGTATVLSPESSFANPPIPGRYRFGAIIFVTRPTLVSPAYRLSCLSITQ